MTSTANIHPGLTLLTIHWKNLQVDPELGTPKIAISKSPSAENDLPDPIQLGFHVIFRAMTIPFQEKERSRSRGRGHRREELLRG